MNFIPILKVLKNLHAKSAFNIIFFLRSSVCLGMFFMCFAAWGQSLVEKCEQAHRALAASEVELIIQGLEDWIYRLEFQRPHYARYYALKKGEKSPREEALLGENKAFLIHHGLKQYRVVPFKKGLGFGSRFELAMPNAPELLGSLLEPAGVSTFLRRANSSKAWKENIQGATRTASGPGIKIGFDSSGRLSRIEASAGQQKTIWQALSYSRFRRARPMDPPASYYLVSSFNPRVSPPAYADEGSFKMLSRAIRFYSGLRQANYTVESNRLRREIFLNYPQASERSAQLSWAFDGKGLKVLDHQKRLAYSGFVPKAKVVTALGKLGWTIDPTLSYLWRGRNPIHYYLNKDMRLSQAGSIVLNSANCSILHAVRKGQRISLVARISDGALFRLSADTLDSSGKKLSSTDRLFEYKSMRRPLGKAAFMLKTPKGYQAKPLSSLIRS